MKFSKWLAPKSVSPGEVEARLGVRVDEQVLREAQTRETDPMSAEIAGDAYEWLAMLSIGSSARQLAFAQVMDECGGRITLAQFPEFVQRIQSADTPENRNKT